MNNNVSNQEIQLNVSIEEANVLLEALGEMPFKKVFGLVGKIQQQASSQINPQTPQVNGKEEVKPQNHMAVHE
ncbi:hypothetical protein [Microscilla marina]|uniref:Uncharacterized protein n=1 Tax=Microscilla marina ATCC 23134 TaxID=313606 RepID=A1ZC11_MICM2|nr:hypothetical protein [Microscilla marina]EAY31813.1 hypothetical protein M23134_01842 [Microscilla marina ATCC 23134]